MRGSVDSALVDTVAPPHVGESIPLKENKISKNGIKFRAANGTPLQFTEKSISTVSTVTGAL